MAQRVKHLSAVWETWVWSLGREDPLEKEMATHSSILACRIPWTEEPGRLQSMGLQRVGHDWVTSLWKIPFRRKWIPIPVFLSGKFHGQKILVDCSSWGHKQSDPAEYMYICAYTLHQLYPFIHRQNLRWFTYPGYMNDTAVKMGVQISHQDSVFLSFV